MNFRRESTQCDYHINLFILIKCIYIAIAQVQLILQLLYSFCFFLNKKKKSKKKFATADAGKSFKKRTYLKTYSKLLIGFFW